MTEPRKYLCPSCKDLTGVPPLWGLPSLQEFEADEREEVVLAGCDLIHDEDGNLLNLACLRCEHQWFDPEAKYEEEKEDSRMIWSQATSGHPKEQGRQP